MAWDLRPFAIGRKGDGLWLAGPGGRVGLSRPQTAG
jgi:hypothetical protein